MSLRSVSLRKNAQAAQRLMAGESREDPVPAQKEIVPQSRGQKAWAQMLCLDQSDCKKSKPVKRIESEGCGQQRLENFRRQRISEHQRMAKMRGNRNWVPFEQMQHDNPPAQTSKRNSPFAELAGNC
jgi:hypothetical protein